MIVSNHYYDTLRGSKKTIIMLHSLWKSPATGCNVEIGLATVVSDCQKFFRFLPVTYHFDIRTANFMETKLKLSGDNSICMAHLSAMP